MSVYVDQFLFEFKSKFSKTRAYQNALNRYKVLKQNLPANLANATMAQEILTGEFEWQHPDQPLTHAFRKFAKEHTDYVGNGGII